jgi:uncharacterized radical SAM protein YgiQ
MMNFLPISKSDMDNLGWTQCDFVLISADAYVDHPSFGHAIIARVLEKAGYKVGIIAQPDWKDPASIKVFGKPRYGFLISGGNIDSMVNHYTASKKMRSDDAYSPGGKAGFRPDRATLVYCNLVRAVYKKVPVIIGGIEASLRRFAHYDYWQDKVRRSLLIDSEADLLIYGMGEHQIVEIADCLRDGFDVQYIRHIAGTCYVVDQLEDVYDYQLIESFEEISTDKKAYCKAFMTEYREQNPMKGKLLVQKHGNRYLVQNPPAHILSQEELDDVYRLPYMRTYHPIYEAAGGIPAIQEVKHSLVSERGCFGACSFCALSFHQGKIIQARSHESLLEETQLLLKDNTFKGNINDVGGPTANFRHMSCAKQLKEGACKDKECLYPTICKNLKVDHKDYLELLRKLRKVEGIKRVFVRSGLRYDYIMADPDETFLEELITHHVSGQLKIAPEHIDETVLDFMMKPCGKSFDAFSKKFYKITERVGKEQYIVPYLMSSHPGSTLKSAIKLAEYLRDIKYQPEQVQDFYPTPGTMSTCMFYTEMDPRTLKPMFIPKSPVEKKMQRALLQYSKPANYDIVYEALQMADRPDLIGNGPKCLIKPKVDPNEKKRKAPVKKEGPPTRFKKKW